MLFIAWCHIKPVDFPWCCLYLQFQLQLYLWRHETTCFDWKPNERSSKRLRAKIDRVHNEFSNSENELILEALYIDSFFPILWLIFTSCWNVSIYPLSLVNSILDVKIFSTGKSSKTRGFLASWMKKTLILWLGKSIKIKKPKVEITWYVELLLQTLWAT